MVQEQLPMRREAQLAHRQLTPWPCHCLNSYRSILIMPEFTFLKLVSSVTRYGSWRSFDSLQPLRQIIFVSICHIAHHTRQYSTISEQITHHKGLHRQSHSTNPSPAHVSVNRLLNRSISLFAKIVLLRVDNDDLALWFAIANGVSRACHPCWQ